MLHLHILYLIVCVDSGRECIKQHDYLECKYRFGVWINGRYIFVSFESVQNRIRFMLDEKAWRLEPNIEHINLLKFL